MKEIWAYLLAVFNHWLALMSGGIIIVRARSLNRARDVAGPGRSMLLAGDHLRAVLTMSENPRKYSKSDIIGLCEVAQSELDLLFADRTIAEQLRVQDVLKVPDSEDRFRMHFSDDRFVTFQWRFGLDYRKAVKEAVVRQMFGR